MDQHTLSKKLETEAIMKTPKTVFRFEKTHNRMFTNRNIFTVLTFFYQVSKKIATDLLQLLEQIHE